MIDNVPSRQVLAELPARLVTFLGGIGRYPALRAIMAGAGYTQAEHDRGWELLQGVSGYRKQGFAQLVDIEVRDALQEIDAWDEPNFRIMRACLQHKHPEQGAFLFEGLAPGKGVESVLAVKTLLGRLTALESGADRANTREADQAAIATLAQRGYTAAERKRLSDLVSVAQRGTQSEAADAALEASPSSIELEAYHFYNDWSETARVRVKRRDQLIILGLAKRRRTKAEGDDTEPTEGEEPAAQG